jgi:L,D-peptidoglycan transpeptidase YkuD (ErfK/YbiS/YcfS/YnhG family)
LHILDNTLAFASMSMIEKSLVKNIFVTQQKENKCLGKLCVNNKEFICSIGRNGIISPHQKKEGDGCTPSGTYSLRSGFFNPRVSKIIPENISFHLQMIKKGMTWDDNLHSPTYNTLINSENENHPERLFRDDHIYDVIIPIGYNDQPIIPGKGSAIFFHIAREELTPTEGCVAVRLEDMLKILPLLNTETKIIIEAVFE